MADRQSSPSARARRPKRPASVTFLRSLAESLEAIDRMLDQGRLSEAEVALARVGGKARHLGRTSPVSRVVRVRIAELQNKLRRLKVRKRAQAARPRSSAGGATASARENTQPRATITAFVCGRCGKERPVALRVKKLGQDALCAPCATGEVCPRCRGSKSSDFEVCLKCSGKLETPKILYTGAFESNRRRH